MKTKVCLGLAVALVVFLLGGLVMNQMVTAQINTKLPWPPTSVVFEEDPHREHALQVRSFNELVNSIDWTDFFTVPVDKKYIITDVSSDISSLQDKQILALGNGTDTVATFRFRMDDFATVTHHNYRSGIVFEPGDLVQASLDTYHARITISGYLVDL